MATYLTLINNVLRELRETQLAASTTAIVAGSYAELIGHFVNQAKEEIEAAWNWKVLRTDITFPTIVSTKDYNLGAGGVGSSATNERARLLYDSDHTPLVFDLTSKTQLAEVPLSFTTANIAILPAQSNKPYYFSQIRSNAGHTLRIFPTPNAVASMQATFFVPQASLVAPADILLIPTIPVWRKALAYAFAERGDGMGQRAQDAHRTADRYLADAIETDAEDNEFTVYQT